MANKTWSGANGSPFETGASWGGSAPGVNDKAIITDCATSKPADPVSLLTVHDLDATNGNLTVGSLNVSNTVVATDCLLTIGAQTSSGSTVTLNGASSITGIIAAPIAVKGTSSVNATCNGDVTFDLGVPIGLASEAVINAAVNIPTGQGEIGFNPDITWGASSSIHFTGVTGTALVISGDFSGLHLIFDGELFVYANSGEDVSFAGSTIDAGGTVSMVRPSNSDGDPLADGSSINIAGLTANGTAAAYFSALGTTGSPAAINGFAPAYTVGTNPAVLSARGSPQPVNLPDEADVRSGVHFGVFGILLTGTLSAGGGGGGGGMGLGLG